MSSSGSRKSRFDGEPGIQGAERVLENNLAAFSQRKRHFAGTADIFLKQRYLALTRLNQPGKQLGNGGFSAPGLSQNAECFARIDAQRDVLKRRLSAAAESGGGIGIGDV